MAHRAWMSMGRTALVAPPRAWVLPNVLFGKGMHFPVGLTWSPMAKSSKTAVESSAVFFRIFWRQRRLSKCLTNACLAKPTFVFALTKRTFETSNICGIPFTFYVVVLLLWKAFLSTMNVSSFFFTFYENTGTSTFILKKNCDPIFFLNLQLLKNMFWAWHFTPMVDKFH